MIQLYRHTQLFVSLGGVPAKNAQISSGGATEHAVPTGLRRMAVAGCASSTSVRCATTSTPAARWTGSRSGPAPTPPCCWPWRIRCWPKACDRAFLASHCVGFERVAAYLRGESDGQAKTADWAAAITGIPATRIVQLAREMAAARTMINIAWSLQRAHHGEQPYWALITVASTLGQIGLPGGGFGVGYGTST